MTPADEPPFSGGPPAAGSPSGALPHSLPHSLRAERSLLGGLIQANQRWDDVADRVAEGDFYRPEHRLIFRTIQRLADQGKPFDVVTLAETLNQANQLQQAGGLPYLADLVESTPTADNVPAYAEIVRERSVLRQLIAAGQDISGLGFAPAGRPVGELLDAAEQRVFGIAEQLARGGAGFQPLSALLTQVIDRITELYQRNEPITGVPTGFRDLDKITAGLQPADLIIIAGRPSQGKTALAMNIAEHAALKTGAPVAVFSMEMPGDALTMRLMASLGHIDLHRVRSAQLAEEEWPQLTQVVSQLAEAPILIDDTPALSPTEVRARARRLKRERGDLGLIILDYLQLMQIPGTRENRTTEISTISRSLKALARELRVPVIALSQLNRSLESRTNKRPVMSDLRESGGIEQDADLILFVYRDEVYNEESPDKGTAEIIIGKHRNGPLGTVRLTFLSQYTRFENHMPDLSGVGP